MYPTQPVVGVAALVWREDRILLIRRAKAPRSGEWSLPGGRQELGETVAQAARREVAEETGVDVAVLGVVDVVDSIHHDHDGRIEFHYTLIDMLAQWHSGEAIAGDDASAVAWATLDELGEYGLWSETERVIRLSAHLLIQRRSGRTF